MKEMPRWAIELAYESAAKIEYWSLSFEMWQDKSSGPLRSDCKYRIANKTSDGLRLDELLEQAEWDVENIEIDGDPIHIYSKVEDVDELIYWMCKIPHRISAYSLKKPVPTMRDMTAQEMAMLPRGTAFWVKNSDLPVYNPTLRKHHDGRVRINGLNESDYDGYTLPTDVLPLKFGYNPLKVEVE